MSGSGVKHYHWLWHRWSQHTQSHTHTPTVSSGPFSGSHMEFFEVFLEVRSVIYREQECTYEWVCVWVTVIKVCETRFFSNFPWECVCVCLVKGIMELFEKKYQQKPTWLRQRWRFYPLDMTKKKKHVPDTNSFTAGVFRWSCHQLFLFFTKFTCNLTCTHFSLNWGLFLTCVCTQTCCAVALCHSAP